MAQASLFGRCRNRDPVVALHVIQRTCRERRERIGVVLVPKGGRRRIVECRRATSQGCSAKVVIPGFRCLPVGGFFWNPRQAVSLVGCRRRGHVARGEPAKYILAVAAVHEEATPRPAIMGGGRLSGVDTEDRSFLQGQLIGPGIALKGIEGLEIHKGFHCFSCLVLSS